MTDAVELRVCDRAALRQPVVVVPPEGEAVSGMLVNASLGGMLVELAPGAGNFAHGQTIELHLASRDGGRAYPCKIVRASDGLLGLSLDSKLAARFGLELTRGMFARARPAAESPSIPGESRDVH